MQHDESEIAQLVLRDLRPAGANSQQYFSYSIAASFFVQVLFASLSMSKRSCAHFDSEYFTTYVLPVSGFLSDPLIAFTQDVNNHRHSSTNRTIPRTVGKPDHHLVFRYSRWPWNPLPPELLT